MTHSRLNPVLVTLALSALLGGCRLKQTTELEHVTVHEVNDQAGGEEPYFAVIKFQTIVGVPGSTKATFIDERATLDVPTVYPSTGPVPIPTSRQAQSTSLVLGEQLATAANIADIGMPISGWIIVGLEEDDRGWDPAFGIDGIRQTLSGIASNLEGELSAFEDAVWFPQLMLIFQDRIEDFVARAPRSLGGNGGRDDLIGVHILVNVGASVDYYNAMRPQFDAAGIASCGGTHLLTSPQPGYANYILSVCPGGEIFQTHNLMFDAGAGHTTYELQVRQTLGAAD